MDQFVFAPSKMKKVVEGANRVVIGQFQCYSMVEQMRDHGCGVLAQFGDIKGFLRKEYVGSKATHLKLLSFLTNVEKKAKLQLELEVVIDWGHSFVKATYS